MVCCRDLGGLPVPLYLVQHGLAHPKDVDPDRSLTEEGIEETRRMAERVAAAGLGIRRIVHSGKKRAEQTAGIFAQALGPAEGSVSRKGLGPGDDVSAFAGDLDHGVSEMVVGHLPFLEKLVSHLLLGDEEARVIAFRNSGVVRLDAGPSGDWILGWAVVPSSPS
jgi:phosphohistidine phosphatase